MTTDANGGPPAAFPPMSISLPVVGPTARADGPGATFDTALWEFHSTLDELDDYLTQVGPFVESLDSAPRWKSVIEAHIAGWPTKRADEFRSLIGFVHQAMQQALAHPPTGIDGTQLSEPPQMTERPDSAGDSREASEAPPPEPSASAEVDPLPWSGRARLPFNPADPATMQVLVAVVRDAMSPARTGKMPILLRSLITTLVDAEEHLVGALVRGFYLVHPDAMGTDQAEFSVDQLRGLGSIDEAIKVAAERRVDTFIRAGNSEWEKWFRRNAKVEVAETAMDWPRTREITLRRHVIVHNGGRASPQYVASVAPLTAPPLGTLLQVDAEYVREAIDLVDVFGTILAAAVWAHVCPGDWSTITSRIHHRAYAAMKRDRWIVVRALCDGGRRHAVDAADKLTFDMNRLLARKRLGETAAVRAEVEGLDNSALSLRFQLVRLVLADRLEEAESLLPRILVTQEVSLHELQDWPVLAELRSRPALDGLLRKEARKTYRLARKRSRLEGLVSRGRPVAVGTPAAPEPEASRADPPAAGSNAAAPLADQ